MADSFDDPVLAAAASPNAPLEMWGGVECSVVRIGDTWRDQVRETGHHDRPDDLDRVAGLGIRTLRYPVLWERCAEGPVSCGWAWHDARLDRLGALGISPVLGLVHHGSGPPGRDCLGAGWAEGLAEHAARAARRYPGVLAWSPVNEPLTTARFAGLYGIWHPHRRTEAAFDRLVFNQCRAVLLAMRAIRARIPGAQLVQTEDLGRVFATPRLSYQADYENERRWLSLDLLCGRVDRGHAAWRRLVELGIPEADIDEFRGGEAVPDLLGINHYVTSDRFLDHRTSLYPSSRRGGNGRETYVDIEAARIDLPPDATGWLPRLREAWRRYGRPMAITEAHLACGEESEQVRWLAEAWQAALTLRGEGADLRAVTAWSVFGAMDWDSMLQQKRGHYETGAWDMSADPPRLTALGRAVGSLARTGRIEGADGARPGWWRRDERLHVPARRA